MLLKKPREIALGAEAEIFRNATDFAVMLAQSADRGFNTKRIGVDARADAGATAEQVIEVRARQAGIPGDLIEVDGLRRTLAHMPQCPADAIIAGAVRPS
jgi:hypothetical protein